MVEIIKRALSAEATPDGGAAGEPAGRTVTEFALDIRSAPDHEIVCYCSGVTKGRIMRAIDAGAATLADVRTQTGACTVGRCRELSPRRR